MGLFSFLKKLFSPTLDSRSNNKSGRGNELQSKKTQVSSDTTQFDDSLFKKIQQQKEVEYECIRLEKEKEEKRKKEAEEQERRIKLEQERLLKEREARRYEEQLRMQAQKSNLAKRSLTEKTTQRKPDSDKFLDYLRRNGITCFYHFTDEDNIDSIKKHGGLYSWYYCEQNNIDIPNAGGDSGSRTLDMRHGLEDYVRLSFCSDHPMQYRLKCDGAQLVLLRIKIEVATFKDTQFSNMNAASNAVRHGNSFEDLKRVNIFAVKQKYVKRTDDIFAEHQAECMVKRFIPIEYITNINCPERL